MLKQSNKIQWCG